MRTDLKNFTSHFVPGKGSEEGNHLAYPAGALLDLLLDPVVFEDRVLETL